MDSVYLLNSDTNTLITAVRLARQYPVVWLVNVGEPYLTFSEKSATVDDVEAHIKEFIGVNCSPSIMKISHEELIHMATDSWDT